jgi:hypothetical protein
VRGKDERFLEDYRFGFNQHIPSLFSNALYRLDSVGVSKKLSPEELKALVNYFELLITIEKRLKNNATPEGATVG